MGTAIKHPVPGRVKPSFWSRGHFNRPAWHRMLYSCTHMATVGFKGLIISKRSTCEKCDYR